MATQPRAQLTLTDAVYIGAGSMIGAGLFAAYLAPGYEKPLAVAAVATLTAVNYRGITRTAALTKILVTVVLLALAVFFGAVLLGVAPNPAAIAASAGSGAGASAAMGPVTTIYGVMQGAGLLFFTFAGYARIATMGSEVKDPARTIPRAIIIALTLVGTLYLLVALALIHQLGYAGLAGSSAPLAAAVGSSAPLSALMGIAASIGALGALLALITGIGRTGHAMAAHRDLPAYFAHLHPVYGVPYRLEIAVAVAVTALILFFDVRGAIGFSSFGVLLYYCVANLAAFTQTAPYRRYPRALQVAGAAGCCLVVGTLPPASIAGGLLLLGVGLAVYLLYARPTQIAQP